jgi:hypothetical protein
MREAFVTVTCTRTAVGLTPMTFQVVPATEVIVRPFMKCRPVSVMARVIPVLTKVLTPVTWGWVRVGTGVGAGPPFKAKVTDEPSVLVKVMLLLVPAVAAEVVVTKRTTLVEETT